MMIDAPAFNPLGLQAELQPVGSLLAYRKACGRAGLTKHLHRLG
jgi:hypothetical protein